MSHIQILFVQPDLNRDFIQKLVLVWFCSCCEHHLTAHKQKFELAGGNPEHTDFDSGNIGVTAYLVSCIIA